METTATTTTTEAVQLPNVLERRLDLSLTIADLDKDVDLRLKRIGKNFKNGGFPSGQGAGQYRQAAVWRPGTL